MAGMIAWLSAGCAQPNSSAVSGPKPSRKAPGQQKAAGNYGLTGSSRVETALELTGTNGEATTSIQYATEAQVASALDTANAAVVQAARAEAVATEAAAKAADTLSKATNALAKADAAGDTVGAAKAAADEARARAENAIALAQLSDAKAATAASQANFAESKAQQALDKAIAAGNKAEQASAQSALSMARAESAAAQASLAESKANSAVTQAAAAEMRADSAMGQATAANSKVESLKNNTPYVNAREFGVKGDGVTDDTVALQNALDGARNSVLFLNSGTYVISSTLYIKYDFTKVTGSGNVTLKWAGPVGGTMVKVDKAAYGGSGIQGSSHQGIQIENLTLDGNGLALWPLYLFGFTRRCEVNNCHLKNAIGLIYAEDCWWASWKGISLTNQVDGLPNGFSLPNWQAINQSNNAAPISFKRCHSSVIDGMRISRVGTSATGATGGANTRSLVYLSSDGMSISNVSIEVTNGFDAKSVAVERLFAADYASSLSLDSIYLEAVRTSNLLYGGNNLLNSLQIRNWRGFRVEVAVRLFSFARSADLTIDGLFFLGSWLHPNNAFLTYATEGSNFHIQGAAFYEGAVINVGGANFANAEPGHIGMVTGNRVQPVMIRLPKILDGLAVGSGADASGPFISIAPGTLQCGDGRTLRFGWYAESPVAGHVGRILRHPIGADNWNVCIDVYGSVFLERQVAPRSTTQRGKVVLAKFTTAADGSVTSLTPVDNTLNGEFINNGANRMIYASAAPAAGEWAIGDVVNNAAYVAGAVRGWKCTTAGTPGIWTAF